jgi:hypothetical protein
MMIHFVARASSEDGLSMTFGLASAPTERIQECPSMGFCLNHRGSRSIAAPPTVVLRMAAPKAIGARTAAISMTATVRTRTTRFMYAPASSIGETPGKLFHRDQATKKRNIATRPGAAL